MDLRQQLMFKARARVQEEVKKEDAFLIHSVRCLDDLDSAKSLLYQRLSEWFNPVFPELKLKNEESLCRFVIEFGSDKKFDEKRLAEIIGEEKASATMHAVKHSNGIPASKEDEEAMKSLAKRVLELYDARAEIQAYVEAKASEKMPNVCALLEPLLAARLLSLAGGLKQLAEMPASTIQVIGAEKSLFKHLRTGTQPPKHGVLFQHPAINSAPLHQRGRIARALATKLAIAVKADYFTHRFIAKKLKEDFDERVKQIQDAPVREKKLPPRQYAIREKPFRSGGFQREGGKPRFDRDDRKPSFNREERGDRPFRREGDRPPFRDGPRSESRPFNRDDRGGRPFRREGGFGDRKPSFNRGGERSGYGERKPFNRSGSKPSFSGNRKPSYGGGGRGGSFHRPRARRY